MSELDTATAASVADDPEELARIIECLLFVAGEPLSAKALAKTAETDEAAILEAIRRLRARYEGAGLHVFEIANGFQMGTRPRYGTAIGKWLAPQANRLSRPALETVTIVAYRQPCTQAEIEAIRGVSVDGVLKTLLERELIKEAGRRQTPGRPILYATTDAFLHYFGLASLEDLPALEEDDVADAEAANARRTAENQAMAEAALTAAGAA